MKKQLLLALLLVAGLAAVFAFKQEQSPRKYLTLTIIPNELIMVVDEKGTSQTNELAYGNVAVKSEWMAAYQVPLTAKLNELATKGYKLVNVSPTTGGLSTYVFEKE